MSVPDGELSVLGRFVSASNVTLLVADEAGTRFVYKPVTGETPLRDFPTGTLGIREVAAWRWSAAAGFDVVPQTCWVTGPFGEGSAQLWCEPDDEEVIDVVLPQDVSQGWFPIMQGSDSDGSPVVLVHRDDSRLRRLALFDVLCNNADRKGGHVIVSAGRVLGVDHGLCFHSEPKLRTVLWGWSGTELTEDERVLVRAALTSAEDALHDLSDSELAAAVDRCARLLDVGEFPSPGKSWLTVPWPPI